MGIRWRIARISCLQGTLVDQDSVDTVAVAGPLLAEAGGIALRVHIDQQARLSAGGEGCGQIDGGGLANPALLVGNGKNARRRLRRGYAFASSPARWPGVAIRSSIIRTAPFGSLRLGRSVTFMLQ